MSSREAHEKEQQLAADYLDTAILARNVSRKALEQALRDAEAGNLRDAAKTAVNAATASGILLDKRLLLEGRPTQIVQVDPGQAANALARKLGLAIDTTASDVTPGLNQTQPSLPAPQNQPLPAEILAPKRARARARVPLADSRETAPSA